MITHALPRGLAKARCTHALEIANQPSLASVRGVVVAWTLYVSHTCYTVTLGTPTTTASNDQEKQKRPATRRIAVYTSWNADLRAYTERIERANDLDRNPSSKNGLAGTSSACYIGVAADSVATTTISSIYICRDGVTLAYFQGGGRKARAVFLN